VTARKPTPLEPREFFGRPWSGTGEWRPRRAVAWLAPPRRLSFRSSATWLTEELWLVHDETRWEDGRVERRDGVARLVAPDRISFTYDDMPGGTEIRLREDGFDFTPYLMTVTLPVLPVAILLRCVDTCMLEPTGDLVDTVEVSLLGVRLGRQTMRLRPGDD
jgi:hypothetical protein